jgi:ketosteroid isomerase-like protein
MCPSFDSVLIDHGADVEERRAADGSAVESWSMSTDEHDVDVVRRYLRTFATRDLHELRTVVADNVEIYGAGQFARGRHNVEAAVMTPGLTVVDQQIVELYSAGHRVVTEHHRRPRRAR